MENIFINNGDDLKAYNVCLLGASLDTGNMGVSALASSLIAIILKVKPDASIKILKGVRSSKPQEVLIDNKIKGIGVENFRLSLNSGINKNLFWIFFLSLMQKIVPTKNLKIKIIKGNPFLLTLYNADFIGQIRGGDSFSDIYGLKKFIIGSLPSIIVILLGKKHALLPQTYGPFRLKISRIISQFIIKHSYPIISRDKNSIEYLNKMFPELRNEKSIVFCPDVAFTLHSKLPKKVEIIPTLSSNETSDIIGVNISGLLYNGGFNRNNMFGLKVNYKEFINDLVEALLEISDTKILLVPHTVGAPGHIENDLDASQKVFDNLNRNYPERLLMVTKAYNQYEIKAIIRLCSFFLGSRMHACIAACSQGIPTIGVAYSKKFLGVFGSVGIGNLVQDLRCDSGDTIISNIKQHYNNRENIRHKIKGNIENAKELILKTFREIII